MDRSNYDKLFEGVKTMLIRFAEVLVSAHDWYERNAENIAKYLLVFADFGTWCSATDKLAPISLITPSSIKMSAT